jgi:hypothetical protein
MRIGMVIMMILVVDMLGDSLSTFTFASCTMCYHACLLFSAFFGVEGKLRLCVALLVGLMVGVVL